MIDHNELPGITRTVGEMIQVIERVAVASAGMKMMNVDKALAQEHYKELSDKPFYPSLCEYICSAPVIAMVWEGKNVVAMVRKMIGSTKPWEAEPGTVRGDFCVEVGRNVIHASDSNETASKEMKLWFPEGLCEYTPSQLQWIYEASVENEAGKGQPSRAEKGATKSGKQSESSGLEGYSADQKKKSEKEGGKKGADLAGMSEMGGQEFFVTAVDEPDGELPLVELAVQAMEREPDPNEAEKKGGAGYVGKAVISSGAKQLAMVASIPSDLKDKGVHAAKWLEQMVSEGGEGAGQVEKGSSSSYAKAIVPADPSSGRYAIRMKDSAIQAGIQHLKSVGALPEKEDSESSDDDINYAEAAGIEW